VEYGPALVTGFRLEQHFLGFVQADEQNPTLPFFEGEVQDEIFLEDGTMTTDEKLGKVKCHSMVLVGMRRFDNEWRLLLQNWWDYMQFVEVSAEYLISSGADLVWARNKQTNKPDNVPILHYVHAETFVEGGGGDIREHIFEGTNGKFSSNLCW
jgi:hypothetical protein